MERIELPTPEGPDLQSGATNQHSPHPQCVVVGPLARVRERAAARLSRVAALTSRLGSDDHEDITGPGVG